MSIVGENVICALSGARVAHRGPAVCKLSLGMQIAVNGTAQSQDHVAVADLVEIFYDDIFPAPGWEPF